MDVRPGSGRAASWGEGKSSARATAGTAAIRRQPHTSARTGEVVGGASGGSEAREHSGPEQDFGPWCGPGKAWAGTTAAWVGAAAVGRWLTT
jgi:hypothetical protein